MYCVRGAVVEVPPDGGLAPHTQLPGLVEVSRGERHEEVRPRGVEASEAVESDGMCYDV